MLNAIGRTVFAVAIAASAAMPASAMAQTKPIVTTLGPDFPQSEIFIGNSFFYRNNSMHSQVLGLERAADAEHAHHYRATSITISGGGLNWHDVDSYFRPNAVGSYSFVGDNEIRFNKLDRLFDAAIMMDCSQCPIHPQLKELFTEYARKDADIVRSHGAKPVFFMSWAYACRADRQIAGRQQLSRQHRREDRELPAGDRLGNRAGLLRQVTGLQRCGDPDDMGIAAPASAPFAIGARQA
jgi:hypothetical protein